MKRIVALSCATLFLVRGAAAQQAPTLVGRIKVTSEKFMANNLTKGEAVMLTLKIPKGARKFVVKMRMRCGTACNGTMFLGSENFGPRSTRANLLMGKRFDRSTAENPITFERPEGFDGGKFNNFFIMIVADSGIITLARSESELQVESKEITRSFDLVLEGTRHIVPTMSNFKAVPGLGTHYELEAYR